VEGLSAGTEILRFAKDPDNSEWYVAQLAIGGVPCVPFSVGAPDVAAFSDEASLLAYLEQQASALIEAYGDGRNPRQDAFSEYLS